MVTFRGVAPLSGQLSLAPGERQVGENSCKSDVQVKSERFSVEMMMRVVVVETV